MKWNWESHLVQHSLEAAHLAQVAESLSDFDYPQAECTQHHLPGKMLRSLPILLMKMCFVSVCTFHACALSLAPLRTVWVHPTTMEQQRCNTHGWCENTLVIKEKGGTERFTEERVTRLSSMKRKFIYRKFKLIIFKICELSSCSTNLAIFCQEANQKELWGTPVHCITQIML